MTVLRVTTLWHILHGKDDCTEKVSLHRSTETRLSKLHISHVDLCNAQKQTKNTTIKC